LAAAYAVTADATTVTSYSARQEALAGAAATQRPWPLVSMSGDMWRGGHGMADFDELSWKEAMRRGHAALLDSEDLYDDINASEGRSNLDIEKHLRRSEVKAMQAQVWLALARELGSQGDRYGHPGT
jgi:hypothetical protein